MFYCSMQRTSMDFLVKAKKRAAASADCEIIDIEPLSTKVPDKVGKKSYGDGAAENKRKYAPRPLRKVDDGCVKLKDKR